MGAMAGGKPPADARATNDYSAGYRNSTLPGYEMADKLSIPKLSLDDSRSSTAMKAMGASGRSCSPRGKITTSSGCAVRV
ncbi:hypothetical protein ACRAWD_20620 [Caulobacter segnis]